MIMSRPYLDSKHLRDQTQCHLKKKKTTKKWIIKNAARYWNKWISRKFKHSLPLVGLEVWGAAVVTPAAIETDF